MSYYHWYLMDTSSPCKLWMIYYQQHSQVLQVHVALELLSYYQSTVNGRYLVCMLNTGEFIINSI